MRAAESVREWYWLDTFLFFIRTIWICFNANWVIGYHFYAVEKWILFFSFCCIYLLPYIFNRPNYINPAYYLVTETLLIGSMFIYISSKYPMEMYIYSFLMYPCIAIGYACQEKPFTRIGPIVCLVFFAIGTWVSKMPVNWDVFSVLFDAALLYGLGYSLGQVSVVNRDNKVLIQSIEEKNRTLEQYAKKIEELTIMEERNRVSQDLHDTVGHIFTSVITSLDALPFLLEENKEEATRNIQEISYLARIGLEDVRKTIHQLSPINQQSISESMTAIIHDYKYHTATEVDFVIEGEERELGERIKFTIVRCLQEALTNAKRHGHASYIKVKLLFKQEGLILHIHDNGKGCSTVNPGFGLRAMEDRISSLMGRVSIKSELNQGMEITCSIPLGKEVGI